MTKDLLWEVGVEEIPARFLPPAIKQMEQLAREAFGEAGLAYDELHTYATPRRLTLAIAGRKRRRMSKARSKDRLRKQPLMLTVSRPAPWKAFAVAKG